MTARAKSFLNAIKRAASVVFATMFLAVGCGGVTDGAVSDASAGIGGAVSDGGAGIGGSGTGGLGTGGLGTGGLGTGGQRAQGCALLVGQMDGSYLFALSLVTGGNASNKDRPILYLNTVTTTAGIGALNVKWGLQPLRWEDRKTPTGSPLTFSFTLSGGGSADLDLPPLDVPADANPLSGSPITLDIASLNGPSCDVASFYCGTTDGDVTKPIPLSIDGSTWTMERIVGGAYPEPPKIDCAKNLAQELPP